MSTSIDEVTEFLVIAQKKGSLNPHTAKARRTACSKLFSVLDDDQRNVEYVRDHFDVIKARFQNLNKEVMGQTVDIYVNRAQLALEGFTQWKTDRAGWERDAAARSGRSGAEKKARDGVRAENTTKNAPNQRSAGDSSQSSYVRIVKIPLSSGFEVSVTLPQDFMMADARRVAVGLAAQTKDFDLAPGSPTMNAFTMLDGNNGQPRAE